MGVRATKVVRLGIAVMVCAAVVVLLVRRADRHRAGGDRGGTAVEPRPSRAARARDDVSPGRAASVDQRPSVPRFIDPSQQPVDVKRDKLPPVNLARFQRELHRRARASLPQQDRDELEATEVAADRLSLSKSERQAITQVVTSFQERRQRIFQRYPSIIDDSNHVAEIVRERDRAMDEVLGPERGAQLRTTAILAGNELRWKRSVEAANRSAPDAPGRPAQ
jgi:hypothetical protein